MNAHEQRYELKGTVVSVETDAQRVTIKHDAIPGYMDAMTMPFRVKDGRMMAALQPGRLVTADLVVSGASSWLENIVVSTAPGAPSLPSRVEGATEPTPGQPARGFELIDDLGRPVSLSQYHGKAVALTFIYTRCPLPDYCPLMTENFVAVERALAADSVLLASTQLLTISIDPDHDSPAVLHAYALRFAARSDGTHPPNWAFLTGTSESVRKSAESYGLTYATESGQIIHNLRTAVVAPDGTLVKVYRGNDWKPDELVRDLTDAAKGTVPPF
jgi:protein SCO1/2